MSLFSVSLSINEDVTTQKSITFKKRGTYSRRLETITSKLIIIHHSFSFSFHPSLCIGFDVSISDLFESENVRELLLNTMGYRLEIPIKTVTIVVFCVKRTTKKCFFYCVNDEGCHWHIISAEECKTKGKERQKNIYIRQQFNCERDKNDTTESKSKMFVFFCLVFCIPVKITHKTRATMLSRTRWTYSGSYFKTIVETIQFHFQVH